MNLQDLKAVARFCRTLALAGLCLTGLGGVGSAAQDWQSVDRAAVDKYLFLPGGGVLQRLGSDLVLDFYASGGKDFLVALVKQINAEGLTGGFSLHMLSGGAGNAGHVDFAIGTSPDFFDIMLNGQAQAGGSLVAVARRTGCFAVPRASGGGVISGGKIIVRDDLKGDRLHDCLLRGLLINAGLGNVQTLAAREEPFSDAERAEALAALKLLYHPKVRPGMTRDQFLAALQPEGLIR